MGAALKVEGIGKTYHNGQLDVKVLDDVSFVVGEGERIAVVGPSGSGKTTLLSLCAGLDVPSAGRVNLLGRDLQALSEDGRAALRNQEVGFIFQSFHLMPSLTAVENVMLPLELLGKGNPHLEASDLLELVGLKDRGHHYPAQLSGGEQQRVAIARAFINQPRFLFADEPTGNLDRETSQRITQLLFDLNRNKKTTLLLITHDEGLARQTDRILFLDGGKVKAETSTSN